MCKLFVREFVSYVSNQYIYIARINQFIQCAFTLFKAYCCVVVNEFY